MEEPAFAKFNNHTRHIGILYEYNNKIPHTQVSSIKTENNNNNGYAITSFSVCMYNEMLPSLYFAPHASGAMKGWAGKGGEKKIYHHR